MKKCECGGKIIYCQEGMAIDKYEIKDIKDGIANVSYMRTTDVSTMADYFMCEDCHKKVDIGDIEGVDYV